jgi:hypothetical protein
LYFSALFQISDRSENTLYFRLRPSLKIFGWD